MQLNAGIDPGSGAGYDGWICTYYIYDDFGSLRCVVQPEGVKWLSQNSWIFTATTGVTILAEQCFRYEYDARKLMIMKKVPGAGEVSMVYDARDRLVLTQDANLRSNRNWMYTWYDQLNRQVKTGIYRMLNESGTAAARRNTMASEAASKTASYIPANMQFDDSLTITYYDVYANLVTNAGQPLSALLVPMDGFEGDNNTAYPFSRALVQSNQTKGMVTFTKARVLSSSAWSTSVNIYDAEGRVIQVKNYNPFGKITDIITTQYGFAGQPVRTLQRQRIENNGSTRQTLVTVSSYEFDAIGRVQKTKKQHGHVYGTSLSPNLTPAKTIAEIKYDALGQVKDKKLGLHPTNGGSLENLKYDYNIRGWLLGINKSFLDVSTVVNPGVSNWFGFELQYNSNHHRTQYNGNISIQNWRTAGDGVKRSFEYYYDAANRFRAAAFYAQKSNGGWGNEEMDLSSTTDKNGHQNPDESYDLNGNLKQLLHRGYKIGATPWESNLDVLTYQYFPHSNRLKKVTDQVGVSTGSGDFSDIVNNGDDYAYDGNGNLTKDLNKRIGTVASNGIIYNHLNLPENITVRNADGLPKGCISYTYDAGGNKIRKQVEEAGVTIGTTTNITIITTTEYRGGAVYESKIYTPVVPPGFSNYYWQLQFLGHEEGRIRALRTTPQSNPTGFAYDYMLKDHLGNVRMVLTEEQQITRYPASTLEGEFNGTSNNLVNHEAKFFKIDGTKITAENDIPSWQSETGTTKDYYNHNGNPPANDQYPAGVTPSSTDRSSKLYKLNATENKTGLEFMLKVMAGDKVDIFGNSYYQNTSVVNNNNSTPLDYLAILTALLGVPGNGMAAKGVTAAQLNTLNSPLLPSFFIRGNNNEVPTNVPKAYLNYIFFDEQFKFVSGGASRVGSNETLKRHWYEDASLQNITVPKNGYIFVYVSNESNLNVFFDNIQVIHKPGPLLEETHYYPFGLTMAGISSKAAGKLENKMGYNGNEIQDKEFSDGSGLDVYDFNARTYDPQIGRFIQVDPLSDEGGQESLSPFHFGYNNPVKYGDPDGKIPIPLIVFAAKFLIGAAIEYGSQVYDNYKSGQTGAEAWKPQGAGGVGKIVLNGATSTVDPSGGVGKKILITSATNVAESVGGQLFDGSTPTFDKTVKDVAVMTLAGNVKLDASGTVNKLEKGAEKLERVARNNPSARNVVQSTEARQAANKANVVNAGAGTATTETTESALGKKTENMTLFGNGGSGSLLKPIVPNSDNTNIKKPLLPIR